MVFSHNRVNNALKWSHNLSTFNILHFYSVCDVDKDSNWRDPSLRLALIPANFNLQPAHTNTHKHTHLCHRWHSHRFWKDILIREIKKHPLSCQSLLILSLFYALKPFKKHHSSPRHSWQFSKDSPRDVLSISEHSFSCIFFKKLSSSLITSGEVGQWAHPA